MAPMLPEESLARVEQIPPGREMCPECGNSLDQAALSCRACGRLIHGNALRALSAEAQAAATAGDLAQSRDLWMRASALLPPDTVQLRSIRAHIADLDAKLDANTPSTNAKPGTQWWRKFTSAAGPV